MQAVSQEYKQEMKKQLRDHSYIRVTIGLINQEAQAFAYVPDPEDYTYYSNLKWPLDNYQVTELYAACDQDYVAADGRMYFLPRDEGDVVLNQGIVTEELFGKIKVQFPVPYDIKGLTIEFGKAYPVDFTIRSDSNTVEITGNAAGHFVTEEIFEGATFLEFTPARMVNGQGRFRIHQLTMGIGIYFDNRTILSATKKEHISPVMEELPSIDFDLTVDNKNRAFDIENSESSVNFLEIGQEVDIIYGQELDDGTVEWMPGANVRLKEWSADDEEMNFSATDRFDTMDGTYYRGIYHPEGISLYDLAVDVFQDAGIDSRTYWIDSYLKDVKIKNPIPAVSHKEALQLIANASRCVLYQDRTGNIFLKSSFIPDMAAASENETYFSHTGNVLSETEKSSYAMASMDYSDTVPSQYFLPRETTEAVFLETGYISEAVADSQGLFQENPTIRIELEARYKCFGMTILFGRNHPKKMIFHSVLDGESQEDYELAIQGQTVTVSHEFPEFDCLILEFTEGFPNNRVVVDQISFGDSTDYTMEYGHELTKTPKGTQLGKVRELQVLRTLYREGTEEKQELAKETIQVSGDEDRHVFYFSSPSYGLEVSITDAGEEETVYIVESSSYYAEIGFSGVSREVEVIVSGKEYGMTQAKVSRQLNPTGSLEVWENPLISEVSHAEDLADWIGDYMKADREYDLTYRGEPRIDANDIAFLENKYVPDMLIRVYDHTLKFNGALSGTIKARRDMSHVAAAKNGLDSRRFF